MVSEVWIYVIQGLGTAVVTIIGNYLWLSFQVKQQKKDINGIGMKLNGVIEKQVADGKKIAYIRGYLSRGGFKSKKKS